MSRDAEALVEENRQRHDKFAETYDADHREIYNPIEQGRIASNLSEAKSAITSGSDPLRAIDFGAGTGNLTRHLHEQSFSVTATDISQASLDLIQKKIDVDIELVQLNGKDLSNFTTDAYDILATYSVLHHIPDYLPVVEEFTRIVKPGGVIVIDHEACPSHWEMDESYMAYLRSLGDDAFADYLYRHHRMDLEPWSARIRRRLPRMLSVETWQKSIARRMSPDKELTAEKGDIHVFKDRHIDWDAIRETLLKNCEIVSETDYLVCRETSGDAPLWNEYKSRCVDMRCLCVRRVK